jgi:hypothetical protein
MPAESKPQVKTLKLTVREGDDEIHEFIIRISPHDGTADIRKASASLSEADSSVPCDIGNLHCPVCLDNEDLECEAPLQTLVLGVELLDA